MKTKEQKHEDTLEGGICCHCIELGKSEERERIWGIIDKFNIDTGMSSGQIDNVYYALKNLKEQIKGEKKWAK